MSMYPWHGAPNHSHPHPHTHQHSHQHPPSSLQQTATSTSSSSGPYQMPQLRWLPSMLSRSQQQQHQHQQHQQQQQQQQQQHHHHQNSTLPTISSNLRMAQNSNHQPVSVVVESRPPRHQPAAVAMAVAAGEESVEEGSEVESDHSDSGVGMSRDMVVLDAPGNADYATSPEGRRSGGGGGLAIAASDDREDHDDMDMGVGVNTGNMAGDARKHGKRLTTKEEVSLFDICNNHAHEFGQRSNLCKWWVTVTAEFTQDQGHPYSWHSVRRKVEMVTKQRMKFLEEQHEKGASGNASEDLSNPRWRAAVDAWIPTWRRWEEAEAKRIQKRDSRKTRKRKSRPWEYSSWDTTSASVSVPASDGGWRAPSSPVVDHTSYQQHPAPVTTPAPAPASHRPVSVRLPPGFDSMFSNPNPNPSPQTPQTERTSTTYSYQPTPPQPTVAPTPTPPPAPAPAPASASASASATPATEGNMMTAVLETLGKLNKHLDAASPDPPSRSSPIISALASQKGHHSTGDNTAGNALLTPASLSMLKEELRREMHEELRREIEKDRASLEQKLDSVQRTQEVILNMLRQEPA